MPIVYTRESGYGTIDTNAEQFQLGRRLYDAQVMYARLEEGEVIDPDDIKKLIKNYCQLVNWTGMLRADYSAMMEVVEGKAIFREK